MRLNSGEMVQIAAIWAMEMQSNMKIGDGEKDKRGQRGREGGRERPEREGVWERRMGYGREGRSAVQIKRGGKIKRASRGKRGSSGNSMIMLFTYISLQ